jgi:hypothetical protein
MNGLMDNWIGGRMVGYATVGSAIAALIQKSINPFS